MIDKRITNLDEENSSRDARARRESVDIDMNPMVDLAFLLLTFFMLTTTFARPQAMELLMPVKPKADAIQQEQPVKESKTISIVLSGNNRLYHYQGITDPEVKAVSYGKEGIHRVLEEYKASIPGLVVLVKPQETSTYKNLVDVLDEMKASDIQRYAITEISLREKDLIKNHQP